MGNELVDCMYRYIGQTVTIFTTSGGLSGSGFTGVLLSVDCNVCRLVCDFGLPPACAIGSACGYPNYGDYGYGQGGGSGCGGGFGFGYGRNPLGSVVVIPVSAIACFTHNAI